jgi:hypothetical protein
MPTNGIHRRLVRLVARVAETAVALTMKEEVREEERKDNLPSQIAKTSPLYRGVLVL